MIYWGYTLRYLIYILDLWIVLFFWDGIVGNYGRTMTLMLMTEVISGLIHWMKGSSNKEFMVFINLFNGFHWAFHGASCKSSPPILGVTSGSFGKLSCWLIKCPSATTAVTTSSMSVSTITSINMSCWCSWGIKKTWENHAQKPTTWDILSWGKIGRDLDITPQS